MHREAHRLGAGAGPTFPESAWTAFSKNFTIGSSCSGYSGVTVSLLYGSLDSLVLTSTSSGSTNLLSDPGFESNTQTANWSLSGGARPTSVEVHGGATSLAVPAGGKATQTIYNCVPSTSYTVTAWYEGSGTASLQVGTATASTGSSPTSWALLSATGTSTSSGTLLITLSSSTYGVAFDDLTLSEVNVSSPTLTWAQQFGYDGFGNLLSQTVTAGSAPSMSLSVSTSTNRVTNSGVTYDAAGNLTSNGTSSYSYDELNRLISTGLMSYGYNGDNKRVVAYNGQSTPQFTMNLYGPTGQRLSSFTYQNNASNGSGGWGAPLTSNAVNYLYLGSKPLNYSDDTVGSNASAAQYYPYGQVQSGSTPNETQAFGTYVQDASGLLYSDQRYMYQNWGRFLTPDPSDKNIDYTNPGSWNRYRYANGDPINGTTPARARTCAICASGRNHDSTEGIWKDDASAEGNGGHVRQAANC